MLGPDNLSLAEALYQAYLSDPNAVDADWRRYFEALDGKPATPLLAPGTEGGSLAASFIGQVGLFRDLAPAERDLVAGIARPLELAAGEFLFRTGERGDALYVVTRGSLRVERSGKVLGLVGPGQVAGEMAVVDGKPRSADVLAHTDTALLTIPAADFAALLARHGGLARGLLTVVADRLRYANAQQERVDELVRSYRTRGHAIAALDPLGRRPLQHPELEIGFHGLTQADLDQPYSIRSGPTSRTLPLREMVQTLRNTYCRSLGVQFMHIDDQRVRDWLIGRMESSENRRSLGREEQQRILAKLTDAEIFETFIHRKFLGAKRFSLEGGESLIPLLDMAIEEAAVHGVEEIVIGMAHRGRLNVLANILGKSPRRIFAEFQDKDPDKHLGGGGDVKYHMGYSSDRDTATGKRVHLSLCFNPSHLEVVGPVVLGRVRAKQDRISDERRTRVMGLVIHGDAAFAGQGVVQEILNLSGLPGYRTGGTLHVIVNNQVGFTTDPEDSRSSQYATDVARSLDIPIFHVNGEDPEAVAQAIQLAMAFRAAFSRDVVLDMYCYRRHGHNEGDEPSFTQPVMYQWIARQPPVREGYLKSLQSMGGISDAEAEQIVARSQQRLQEELDRAEQGVAAEQPETPRTLWETYRGGPDRETPDPETGVAQQQLAELLLAQTRLPSDFHPHPKIARLLEQKAEMARGERPLDWGAAEGLAFASLLAEGTPVRLSGQDAGRGTFTHRHAVLHDVEDGHPYVPLQHLPAGEFTVWNSPLSETGVLGFDWGYSLDSPGTLSIWEAQFGDFANVAQVMIDQFVVSAEQKWRRLSGLVLLLPHGFEGQGPEHSSARLERFLAMAAHDNIQVVTPSTPAQIFHALRRQVRRSLRKPLVVMSPKSLLRLPAAVSSLAELSTGRFQRVIGDEPGRNPAAVRQVILCGGKFYYDLLKARAERNASDVAILRLEQLYPFPDEELAELLSQYPDGIPVCWAQEEPVNMGAWAFLHGTLGPGVLGRRRLTCVGRAESASPATGSAASHRHEQGLLIDQALAP